MVRKPVNFFGEREENPVVSLLEASFVIKTGQTKSSVKDVLFLAKRR